MSGWLFLLLLHAQAMVVHPVPAICRGAGSAAVAEFEDSRSSQAEQGCPQT